ncbi:hypothetical protein FS837_010772 [Tulasnella sp. UAMH 9824]|nr:hypothetical protein FS837_010772 [Tulasnella sp. UAMH 9824]
MDRIPHYFTAMTQDFARQSHKPTGKHLSNIGVRMLLSRDIIWHHSDLQPCKAGEWFVELISLIPVHIAVARDNCFLPYKDGISGEAIQQELLGTEVADIIDIITLGPYEAILGSYMATRPVKVVSSMGEQSVGKSFSLNHLVDTSFAGSAMRTTEVPIYIHDQVVIALDFEGVHSLERTAQEDMLLVLFNAAVSNLIMFRNNFALNRNVANMFTSFQASARLFDPGNNPNLFKGLLTIIIKDVMDADKKEIVEEFSSKFNQIVNQEQGENFITVLHDNQLAVMPWDVIRSKEFYTRFSKLSKYLFKQQSTHVNAGEFLLTLKTLMAKLTAQDWGAIDQTLIRHRTSILQASLEQALVSGQGDIGPFGELEGLKNYDTQQVLEADDTDAIFYLGTEEDGLQERLANLLARLGSELARSDVDAVKLYLQEIGKQRIAHVKGWIDSNISRFMPTDNSDIKTLQRKFDELFAACVQKLMSRGSITVGLRIGASSRVPSARLQKVEIQGHVGCRLDITGLTYARLQLMSAEPPANSVTSEVVKRHASNLLSMMMNMSALPSFTNVESPADFKTSISTMGDRFHVPMPVHFHSTKIMTPTAAEKSVLARYGANSVHGIAPWVITSMGSNPEQSTCASKITPAARLANLPVFARSSQSRNQLRPYIAVSMTNLAIPSSPKRRDGLGATFVFLQDTGSTKAGIHILWILLLPTSAKHPAPSVDTFAIYPTVMRKGSMIPLMGRCKKPSGLSKIQEMRQLRPKGIGKGPKRAVLPICVSCIANILDDTHTSISVEMTQDTARKQIRSTLMSESYQTLMSGKIGYHIDCSGLGPTQITHDTTSSVDQMVESLLGVTPTGGTNFRQALITARQVMEQSWSAERKALSFWSISFGPQSDVLQEMAEIAKETATRAARGSGVPPIPCDFRTAINTVQLANAFSSIATSLRKTRASLINPTAPAYTRSGASSSALIAL